MKKFIFLIILLLGFNGVSQEVCETPQETLNDLNSITKCSIKSSKNAKGEKNRQLTVKVSASKKRFLKKRAAKKKAVTNANAVNTSGITEISTASISDQLNIKKKSAALSIAELTDNLSEEELKNAKRFNTVDKLPLFNNCKTGKKGDMFDCFNEQMMKHIEKHFNYPTDAVRNMIEGEIWVRFVIDQNGDVRNIKTLGPKNTEILNEEAKRVVTKLPRFTPAKIDGKPVAVKYGFPINFSLDE